MEGSLQEELEGEGFGRVKIVRLENTQMGALGVIGYDEQGVGYKLFPAKDPNLAAMVWPGKEGTPKEQIQEGAMWLLLMAGRERIKIKEGLFVGPAVKYASKAEVDDRGAALWRRVV